MPLNHEKATLVSVYPSADLVFKPRHVGLVEYQHPACQKDKIIVRTYNPDVISNLGKIPDGAPWFNDVVTPCEEGTGYVLINVSETYTITRDWTQDNEVQVPHPISAKALANDMRQCWATAGYLMSGEVGPGIMLIAGDEPTQEEIDKVTANQRIYFERLVVDAKAKEAQGNRKDITDAHRMAGRWFGMDEEWIPRMTERKMKDCRACGEKILAKALRCKHCNVDLLEFYRKHNLSPDPITDPVVADIMTRPKEKAA